MYLAYYGFSRLPFQITPDAGFFFDSRGHSRALATITYGLSKNEGFVVVTGEVGAGKTTLIEYLLSSGWLKHTVSARINTTQLNSDTLLEFIAYAFGLKPQTASKAALLQELGRFFARSAESDRCALLIVDEAQGLSPNALEELRMLSNFQDHSQPLLQMLLVGQPEFRQRLRQAECEQIRQRVIASYHLGPLSGSDVSRYIEHRLHLAGWEASGWDSGEPLFTPDACAAIHTETGGVPRKVNRLCDRLLLYGFLENLRRLDADDVAEVIRDLRAEHLSDETVFQQPVPAGEVTYSPAPVNGHATFSAPNGGERAGNGSVIDATAVAMRDEERAELLRTVHELRQEVRHYRTKMARIMDAVSRSDNGTMNRQ